MSEKSQNNLPILQTVLTFLGGVVVAYLGYLGIRTQVQTPIHATQTAEARQASAIQPTATSVINETPEISNKEIFIEQLPAKVYVYYDSAEISQEVKAEITNELEVITGLEPGIAYKQIFSFPENAPGAGLYFEFSPELDFIENEYQAVAFTINISREIKMQFILAGDGDNGDGFIDLNSSTYGLETGIKVNGGEYYIPLKKNFAEVTKLKWLYFRIRSSNTTKSGSIEYEVSNLRFIK